METQTFANHRHRPGFWAMGALGAIAAVIVALVLVVRDASLLHVGLLFTAYAAFTAVYTTRRFSLTLQDRIIRLEMQTRLARLGREADLMRLSLRQIVALRFASDAELPSLMQRAIDEKMTADQIKRAVTAWQGDYMRT
jgi:hypothetical protein